MNISPQTQSYVGLVVDDVMKHAGVAVTIFSSRVLKPHRLEFEIKYCDLEQG